MTILVARRSGPKERWGQPEELPDEDLQPLMDRLAVELFDPAQPATREIPWALLHPAVRSRSA